MNLSKQLEVQKKVLNEQKLGIEEVNACSKLMQVNEMANNLSNYLKGINYEKVGKYEEAFNIFQNDSSDFSLSKLVIYQYLGLGTDKNYKSSLENLKKIKSQPERKFLASYLLLNEDKKNSIDYLTSLEGWLTKKMEMLMKFQEIYI